MKSASVSELLACLGEEFERVEAQKEELALENSELTAENGRLRLQLVGCSPMDKNFGYEVAAPDCTDVLEVCHTPSAPAGDPHMLPNFVQDGSSAARTHHAEDLLSQGLRPEPPSGQRPQQLFAAARGFACREGSMSRSTSSISTPPASGAGTQEKTPAPRYCRRTTSLMRANQGMQDIRPRRPCRSDFIIERNRRGSSKSSANTCDTQPKRIIGAIGQFVSTKPNSQQQRQPFRTKSEARKEPITLRKIVLSWWFDIAFALLILMNALIMALEAQYNGIDLGLVADYPGSERPAHEAWPGGKDVFYVLEYVLGVLFTAEVLIKVAGLRLDFFKSIWNIFDMVVVAFWVVEKVAKATLALNPMVLRLARVLRLVRLARMVKTIQAFDSLQVLLGSIIASVSALIWSSCLLLVIQMMVGLFLNSVLTEYIADPANPIDGRRSVYRYFGTFTRSMISMFELTLANWPHICWTLVENVNEWYGLIVLVYKLVVGFAVLVVITGVFLHETFKVASSDDELMLVQRQRSMRSHTRKMERLFKEADTSCDGFIQRDEFRSVLEIPKVQTWLSAMELEVADADLLFDFLDDGDEQITVAELIDGVARLKGNARNIDVVALMHKAVHIQSVLEDVGRRLDRLDRPLGTEPPEVRECRGTIPSPDVGIGIAPTVTNGPG